MLATAGRRLGNLLFGGSCFLCRGAAQQLLCAACDADLPRLGAELCPRCALASPAAQLCGRCLAQPPHYDATHAAMAYRFPADVLIHALKFSSELALASLLAELLLQKLDASEPVDCIVPVPLARERLLERGYNQSLEIARHVARAKGARLAPEFCVRNRNTPAQMGLPLEAREKNLRGAFDCPKLVEGLRVAVLDDVMTTGTTLNEIAACLKRAGAARVVNWVIAKTDYAALPRA